MAESRDPAETAQIADRIISAYATITRWSARDFKRRAATPDGLTSTQFAILDLVERGKHTTTSQLADHLDLTVPTVVRAVDALERKGYVMRRRSASDQREVTLLPTPQGAKIRSTVQQMRRERLMDLLGSMTDEEVQGLLLGYEGLVRAVSERGDRGTQQSHLYVVKRTGTEVV